VAEKLITVRDVSQILEISEQEVIELAEKGVIPAYKIAGTHLRFKKAEILHIKNIEKIKFKTQRKRLNYTFFEKIYDFIYFNDFYIVSAILIFLMLWLIFKT
jgi:excisionase family DNA binding protein